MVTRFNYVVICGLLLNPRSLFRRLTVRNCVEYGLLWMDCWLSAWRAIELVGHRFVCV